jgi:glutamate-1-semialdehyde 2,1-aminomutase
MIELLLRRLAAANRVDRVVVATSTASADDPLAAFVGGLGFAVHRGSEHDVLARVIGAAGGARSVVRITGDCPFTDPALVDEVCAAFDAHAVDYASNVEPPTFPDGLDVEVVALEALQAVATQEHDARFREHVTLAIRERPRFRRINVFAPADHSRLRWTVDEKRDLELARVVFERFAPRTDFGWREILAMAQAEPHLFAGNAGIPRNEGMRMDEDAKRGRRED